MRMRVWTVHVRPPDRNRPPRTLLVRDGFALGAFLARPAVFGTLLALAALALLALLAKALKKAP